MFFSSDSLSLELTGVFSIKRTKSCQQTSTSRQHDSISIRLSGKSEFSFDGNRHIVSDSKLLYLPQNSDYTQKTDSENVIAIHFINYSFSEKSKPEIIEIEELKYVKDLILKIYDLWSHKEPGYKHECTSILYHLLYIIKSQTEKNTVNSQETDNLILKAVNYIHKNYKNEKLYISDLARMISVSEVYFRKIFKKIYSTSPNRYINNLRLEYASQLLQSKLYSVSEVSENSGFTDVKYFTKCFKEKYGITPKAYKSINPENYIS